MAEIQLGAVEARFADIIWEREPVTSGELIKLAADKLAWKPKDTPAFMPLVRKQLDKSLDDAAYCYLFNSLEDNKAHKVVHPWARAALEELSRHNIAC